MNDQSRPDDSPPEPVKSPSVKTTGQAHPAAPPSKSEANASTVSESETPKKLTAEEQMALYEEHLKENDWGHQPC